MIFAGLGAKLVASSIGRRIASIPRWAWIALAVVIVSVGAYWYHGRQVRSFEVATRLDERGRVNAQWQAKFDAMRKDAAVWKKRYEDTSVSLANTRRNEHENTLRGDAARASSLLDAGPGKARCGQVNYPSAPASAGRRDARSRPVDAAVDRLPSEAGPDLAAVPFGDFVNRAKVCDANLSEVITWRKHDAEQRSLRDQLVSGQ